MFCFFYLALILVCSVTAYCEQWSSESELRQELTASLQEVAVGVYGNSTWNMPYKCCMCKESVRMARYLVMNELQEKAENICSFLKNAQAQCMSKAKVYQEKIVRSLFPGGPSGICKLMNICK